MKTTIESVKPEPRIWKECPSGPLAFVEGAFTDGSGWSVGCKPDNSAKRMEEMKALIGQEGEFEVEPGKEYQGRKQWKLKAWPGKAPGGFGQRGGGGGFASAFKNTQAGMVIDQWHIGRSVALKAAIDLAVAGTIEADSPEETLSRIVDFAEDFAGWLSKPCPHVPQEAPQAAPATNGKPAGDLAARTAKALEAFRKCQTGQALAEVWGKARPLLIDSQGTPFEKQIRDEHARIDGLIHNFSQGPPDYL
jgi:hypothetical protein